MKKLGIAAFLTWLCLLAGAYFIFTEQWTLSSLVFPAAYTLTGWQTQTHTGRVHIINLLLSSVAIGLIYSRTEYDAWFSLGGLACVLTSVPISVRIWNYRYFIMVKYLFMEATLIGASLILYFLDVNFATDDWISAIAPLTPLGFTGGIAFGMFYDTPGLMKAASRGYRVDPGTTAPDFELPDQDGKPVRLSDFKEKRHVLLIFVRGDWCPWCHMMLRTYQKEVKRFEEKNILLLAVGPDPVGINRDMAEKLGLEFHVLSDSDQRIAMMYGCQLSHDQNKNLLTTNPVYKKYKDGMPLPASFLVARDGKVVYTSRPDRVGEFLDPNTIFPHLQKLD